MKTNTDANSFQKWCQNTSHFHVDAVKILDVCRKSLKYKVFLIFKALIFTQKPFKNIFFFKKMCKSNTHFYVNLMKLWSILQNSKNTKVFIKNHLKSKGFHIIMIKTLKVL